MNLDQIRSQLLLQRTQIFRVSPAGKILESAGSLIEIPANWNGDIHAEDPLLESMVALLPIESTYYLPAVNISLFGKTGYFDLEFHPDEQNPENYLLVLADLTREYHQQHSLQQERNEHAIAKEIVQISAEKIRLENEILELKNQQLEEMRKFRMDFFARISHEFRTPVNGIVGLSKLLQRGEEDSDRKEYLEALSSAGRHLVSLVNDLMDVGKLESGKLQFESRPFSLRKVVKSVMAIFTFQVHEKGILLDYQQSDLLPEILIGDAMRLSQILFNLLGNAVKFTEAGNITLRVFGEKPVENDRIQLRFEVSDTGPGISEAVQAHIFELYYQGGPEITRKYGGTGLGLNIVKELVERQGGTVAISSKPGAGTTISFEIPYQIGQDGEKAESIGAGNVLVVEDNPINRMVISELLKQAGFSVETASSGEEGLKILRDTVFDLILTDMNMPGISGLELLQNLRKTGVAWKEKVPVILLTGSSGLNPSHDAGIGDFQEVLEKPVIPELLIRRAIYYTQGIQLKEPVEIPSISGGKYAYLKTVAGGDQTFMAELIQIFVAETPETFQKLEQAYHSRNWDALIAEAHRYKANLKYVGLSEAHQKMDRIERNVKKGLTQEVPRLLSEIQKAATEAIPELEKMIHYLTHPIDQSYE